MLAAAAMKAHLTQDEETRERGRTNKMTFDAPCWAPES